MTSNPIVSGFHPDPSICRVGDDYYLVTSSFEYAPGVPILHSRDLLNWTQIGNVLDRDDQLDLAGSFGSSGIYAPTIRHHDGRFFVVTSNVGRYSDGHLIVSAEDPVGPWSTPVYTAGAVGIDPDLSWDDGGVCHLTWSAGSGETQIMQVPVDPMTGQLLSEPKQIYGGAGSAHAEAPHLFSRGDWWYLLLAEGGTERGHMATIARSRSIDGPFSANPANPLLSHRSTAQPVQNTGHADFVENTDGTWAAVYLGVRPRGMTPQFHVNGRETFLAGVDWVDDWPVIDEDRYDVPVDETAFDDDLSSSPLHPRWVSPGVHPTELLSATQSGMSIQASPTKPLSRPLVAVRTKHQQWRASASFASGTGRLTLRLDDNHWAASELRGKTVDVRVKIGPLEQVVASTQRPNSSTVVLEVRAVTPDEGPWSPVPDTIQLGLQGEGGNFVVLATIDGRYLSTEVAAGFTGRVIGVEPVDGSSRTGPLRCFSYGPISGD